MKKLKTIGLVAFVGVTLALGMGCGGKKAEEPQAEPAAAAEAAPAESGEAASAEAAPAGEAQPAAEEASPADAADPAEGGEGG